MAITPIGIGLGLKTIVDTLSKARKTTTPKTNSSSSNKNSSSSSKSSSSSNSYAYDPKGNKVNVTIKNGQSYLDNGQRVGTGYTVQTGGGIYKMGDDGKGYKVDSHNSYVNNLVNSLTNRYSGNSNNNNKSSNKNSNNIGLDARSKGISLTPFTDYTNQYNDALLNIYSKNPNADNSVLRNMFTSDILNRNNTDPNYKRYGDFEITQEMIEGYDKAYDENMKSMVNSFNRFDNRKKASNEGQIYLDAINRYKEGNSPGSADVNVRARNVEPLRGTENIINSLVNSTEQVTPTSNNVAPISNNENILNDSVQEYIPFDDNNPDYGGVYQTSNGYILELEGDRIPLTDEEYVELMEEILGF